MSRKITGMRAANMVICSDRLTDIACSVSHFNRAIAARKAPPLLGKQPRRRVPTKSDQPCESGRIRQFSSRIGLVLAGPKR